MPHDLFLILAVAVPTALFVVLRMNAAMIFLSVCLGAVLVETVAAQANDLLNLFAPRAGAVSHTSIELFLLLAPAVATAIFTMLSVQGKVKVMLNAVPAAAASLLAALMAVPLFTPGLRYAIESKPLWRGLSKAEALVVGVGALVSLFFLWTQRRAKHDKRKH
jgi:hypothetical protein